MLDFISRVFRKEEKKTPKESTVFFYLMPEAHLKKLESKFPYTINNSTTAIEVAHQLGIQKVLREIRNGFKVEE